MSSSTSISSLPNDILVEIFNYAGETNIGPVCTLWNEVYQNTLHDGLTTAFGFTCNDNNIPTSTTTELIKHLFKKAVQSGTKEKANKIIHSDAPLHVKLSEIQACNEQTLIIHAYYQFIQKIDPTTKDDELALIKEQQLPFIQELKELKEILKNLNLQTLTTLNLWDNQLTILPPEIGSLFALTVFNLWDNQLKTLPPEIGNLQALTFLDLSGNQLATLLPEIGNLLALTTLLLWNNQLKMLPPEIGNLLALTKLYLSDNQFATLPPEIGNLQALTYLSLEENQLTTLPPELVKLSIFPEIEGNPIIYLPSQLIPKAPAKYQDYAFDLSSDMQKLLDLQSGKTTFDEMPIRLYNLMKQHEDIQSLLSKMQEFDALKTDFITSKSLDVLQQILEFPTKGLHEQQIIEVVLELFSNLEEEHPLKLAINQAVATALALDLEEQPGAGLKKFLFRPLDPEIKQAVLALQSIDFKAIEQEHPLP